MNKWMDEWMDGWMEWWMNELMNEDDKWMQLAQWVFFMKWMINMQGDIQLREEMHFNPPTILFGQWLFHHTLIRASLPFKRW